MGVLLAARCCWALNNELLPFQLRFSCSRLHQLPGRIAVAFAMIPIKQIRALRTISVLCLTIMAPLWVGSGNDSGQQHITTPRSEKEEAKIPDLGIKIEIYERQMCRDRSDL